MWPNQTIWDLPIQFRGLELNCVWGRVASLSQSPSSVSDTAMGHGVIIQGQYHIIPAFCNFF